MMKTDSNRFTPAVEVTPEMIEAGIDTFFTFYLDLSDPDGIKAAINAAYVSMETVRRRSSF